MNLLRAGYRTEAIVESGHEQLARLLPAATMASPLQASWPAFLAYDVLAGLECGDRHGA